jgi:spore germination protein GerM
VESTVSRRPRAGIVALLAVVAVLAGCGVRAQDRAVPIDEQRVPFGLTAGSPGSPSELEPPEAAPVYFVEADGLVPTLRAVAGGLPGRVLRALLVGPTAQERTGGIGTALPSQDAVQLTDVHDGIAEVRLQPGFRDAVRDEVAAIGQVVLTLTDLPEIEAVSFSVEGQPIAVPRADGTPTARPVGRADYEARLAPPS